MYITVRSDDLQDTAQWEHEYCRDKYYVTDAAAAKTARERPGGSRARPKGPALAKRTIDHPNFDNITIEEVSGWNVGVGSCSCQPCMALLSGSRMLFPVPTAQDTPVFAYRHACSMHTLPAITSKCQS